MYEQWCNSLLASLNEKGKWAVPRSGLIFEKNGRTLTLVERLDGFDRDAQDEEIELIRWHFALAGILVK